MAKWTVAKAVNRATAHPASLFLDKVQAKMPFPVQAIQVDGGSEFRAEFEQACRDKGLVLYELPPKRPSSTAPSSAAMELGATSSTASTTCPARSRSSTRCSTPSSIATTTTGPVAPWTASPKPAASPSSRPQRPPSHTC